MFYTHVKGVTCVTIFLINTDFIAGPNFIYIIYGTGICPYLEQIKKSNYLEKIRVLQLCKWWHIHTTCSFFYRYYRIDGKFGGELNLAVWRSPTATPNLISAKLTSAISARKNYVFKFCFAIANRQI